MFSKELFGQRILESRKRFCEHYGVSADYLLGLTDDLEPKYEVKP